jgi:hypothetical protein
MESDYRRGRLAASPDSHVHRQLRRGPETTARDRHHCVDRFRAIAEPANSDTGLVTLYWSIGRDILAQQQASQWGDDVVARIAEDLREGTGATRGFTRRNVLYMRRFAPLCPDPEKVPSVMAQIGWTAHASCATASPTSPASTRVVRGQVRLQPLAGAPS